MSAEQVRDQKYRFYHGFDRWDHAALKHRLITCSNSNVFDHAVDQHNMVWWWDTGEKIWMGISPEVDAVLLAENDLWVATLRRAVPVIRLFARATIPGEKEAAYQALVRLASSVMEEFRRSPHDGGCFIGTSDIYIGAVREDIWQMPDASPPAYDKAIEDQLWTRRHVEMRPYLSATQG